MQITGHISPDGKFLSPLLPKLTAWLKKNADRSVKLTFAINHKRRSLQENKYYWHVVVNMVMEALIDLGHEVNEETTHELLKSKFNSIEVVNKAGVSDEMPGSTAILNTAEFETYLDKIRDWSAQFLGVYIPKPNEAVEMNFEYDNEVGATIVKRA